MKYLSFAVIFTFFIVGQSSAWDGERKGFLLGIGFGAGIDSYYGIQYDSLSADPQDNSSIAFAASPRIGYAWNNQMAVMYARHPLTYAVEAENGDDVQVTSCTEAIQFLYYFKDSAPSVYLGAGLGIGYFFDEEVADEPAMNYSKNSLKGPGVYGIVGFEPFKHINAELAVHYRSLQSGASDLAVSLLIGVMGY